MTPSLLQRSLANDVGDAGHEEEHDDQIVLFCLFFVAICGALIRHFFQKLPLPYTVILVLFGVCLGGVIDTDDKNDFFRVSIDRFAATNAHVILFVFLPPLLFESSFDLDLEIFWRVKWQVLLLAGPGLVVSTFVTGGLLYGAFVNTEWRFVDACLLGAITSATDPVAVVALLKELGASKRIGHVIEGESMVNDGTAIVMFSVLIEVANDAHFLADNGFGGIFWLFVKMSFGAVILGSFLGWITTMWIRQVFNDPFIEISVTLATAYLGFFIAEHWLHVSGVLTVVAIGLCFNQRRVSISPEVQHFLHQFWGITGYLANTLIFVLVGLAVYRENKDVVPKASNWLWMFVVYVVANVVRAGVILLFAPVLQRTGYGFATVNDGALLVWGGLRGAVALALALVASEQYAIHDRKEVGEQMLFYVSGLVMLTLIINAPTMPLLISFLGVNKVSHEKLLELRAAAAQVSGATQKKVASLKKSAWFSATNWEEVRTLLPALNDTLPGSFSCKSQGTDEEFEVARLRFLKSIRRSYLHSHEEGLIGPRSLEFLLHSIGECITKRKGSSVEEWKILRRRVLRRPNMGKSALSIVEDLGTRFKGSGVADRITRGLMYSLLHDQCDVAYGFAISRNEAAELLPVVTTNAAIANRLREECTLGRQEATQFLKAVTSRYGPIVRAIQTSAATRQVLYTQRSEVHRLVHEGILDEEDAERLLATVETRIKQVLHRVPRVHVPTPETILSEVTWVTAARKEALAALMAISQQRIAKRGEVISCSGGSAARDNDIDAFDLNTELPCNASLPPITELATYTPRDKDPSPPLENRAVKRTFSERGKQRLSQMLSHGNGNGNGNGNGKNAAKAKVSWAENSQFPGSDRMHIVVLTDGLVELISQDRFFLDPGTSPAPNTPNSPNTPTSPFTPQFTPYSPYAPGTPLTPKPGPQGASVRQSHVATLGAGTVLGVTSVLTGRPEKVRVCSISEETKYILIPLPNLLELFDTFPELEDGLLLSAGIKIAREVLHHVSPFRHWSRTKLSLWMEDAYVTKHDDRGEFITLSEVTVLVAGEVERLDNKMTKISAPAILLAGPPPSGHEPSFLLKKGTRLLHLRQSENGLEDWRLTPKRPDVATGAL